MTVRSPFIPQYGSNRQVTPAAGSATTTVGKGAKTLRVRNVGATNPAYVRTGLAGDGTVTATAADHPVYPGETVFIGKPQDHDTLAHISAAGTTLEVMAGEGSV